MRPPTAVLEVVVQRSDEGWEAGGANFITKFQKDNLVYHDAVQ